MIARRHIRLLVALLLPLMVLRGLLPEGYMPVAEHGQLRMALCSDGVQPIPDGEPGSHTRRAPRTDCSFALAASLAPPATPTVFVPPAPAAGPAHQSASQRLRAEPPSRYKSARGPPAFS